MRSTWTHAYKFLNFMLEPEVIAKCTNLTNYANANLAAKPFIDPAIARRSGSLSGRQGDAAAVGAEAPQRRSGPRDDARLADDQVGLTGHA